MGASQSSQDEGRQGGITVVHENPKEDSRINLPAMVPPIKLANQEVQLNHRNFVDFVMTIEKFAHSRSDLTAMRQSQLQEKVLLVDNYIQRFTDSYVNGEHKALARMNEDCRQVEEVSKLLDKCTMQSELCADMLNKLNFLLPPEHRLEPFDG